MKVTVRNLGIIKDEATIDLKPLTIFIGPNNSGKTWLAYALAGIFGPYGANRYIDAYMDGQVTAVYSPLDDAIEKVMSVGRATIDLRHFAEEYGEVYFNDVAKYASKWMNKFLSTQYTQFNQMSISIHLAEDKERFLEQINQFQSRSSIAKGLVTIQKTRNNSKVYVYTKIAGQYTEEQVERIEEEIPLEEVKRSLIGFISVALHRSLFPWTRIFPTERTTLVATRFSERVANEELVKNTEAQHTQAKELDANELPTNRTAPKSGIQPIGSFLSMLNAIFRIGKEQKDIRKKQAESDPEVKLYTKWADVLERQVLKGNVQFSTQEPDPVREFLFQPMEDVNLEMPITSSMVKELSPLVLYLRYLAQPGDLVIIDEPEMNLHPEAQAKIIEFLAMLVNAGLNVLITTHSPYITDHLSNLIQASKHENKEGIKQEFFLQQSEAFINKDKVSVYGFNDGKVDSVLDEDGIISWNTFGNVSEKIADIFMKL